MRQSSEVSFVDTCKIKQYEITIEPNKAQPV